MKQLTWSFFFSLAFLAMCVMAGRGGGGRSTSLSSRGRTTYRSMSPKEKTATRNSRINSKNIPGIRSYNPFRGNPNSNTKKENTARPNIKSEKPKNTKIMIGPALRSFLGGNKETSERPDVKSEQPENTKSMIGPALRSFLGGNKETSERPDVKSQQPKNSKSKISPALRSFLGSNKESKGIPDIKSEKPKNNNISPELRSFLGGNKNSERRPERKNEERRNNKSKISPQVRSFLGGDKESRERPERKSKRPKNTRSKISPSLRNGEAQRARRCKRDSNCENLKTEEGRRKYLEDKKVKFIKNNLLWTVEKHAESDTRIPNVIFLEKGNIKAGFEHILDDDPEINRKGHRGQFKKIFALTGSEPEIDDQIKDIILEAVKTKSVEEIPQLNKNKKITGWALVKGVKLGDKTIKINLQIGTNGFIVTSYPETTKNANVAPNPAPQVPQGKKKLKREQRKKRLREEAEQVTPESNSTAGAA